MRNLGLLRTRPANEYDDYSASHLAKGSDYHGRFVSLAGRALMFELEANFLERLLSTRRIENYLDFASGTGRILGLVRGSSQRSYALDVSSSMLDVSRSLHDGVQFLCRDFRRGVEELGGTLFDFITAFRFFANAEPGLRLAAIRFLAGALSPAGTLVLNNHRNFWSLPYCALRASFSRHAQFGMTHREVVALARQASLRIVDHASFGIVPQSEARSVLGWRTTARVERWNAGRCSRFHILGYNTIYVLQRTT